MKVKLNNNASMHIPSLGVTLMGKEVTEINPTTPQDRHLPFEQERTNGLIQVVEESKLTKLSPLVEEQESFTTDTTDKEASESDTQNTEPTPVVNSKQTELGTVSEVKQAVLSKQMTVEKALELEKQSKNRTTLISWLEQF